MEKLTTRAVPVLTGRPSSLNEENRSVEFTAATEAPARVLDRERWEVVDEVLLMDGLVLPANRQVPFLDSHDAGTTEAILGSMRDFRLDEQGHLVGRAYFSKRDRAFNAFRDVVDMHITDVSVGYRVLDSVWIPEGESQVIDGREFRGPLKVSRRWQLHEVSLTPIGADAACKSRSAIETKQEEKPMPELKNAAPENGVQTPGPAPVPEIRKEDVERDTATRAAAIYDLCVQAGQVDLYSDLIRGNATMDQAREKILDAMVSKQAAPIGTTERVELVAEATDKFRNAAVDGLLIRSGFRVEKPAAGAVDFRGFGFKRLALECLHRAGVRTTGMDDWAMLERAMFHRTSPGHTTSDFDNILANVGNKSLGLGWANAAVTYPIWCHIGSLSDFKQAKRVNVSDLEDLEQFNDGQEVPMGTFSDAGENIQLTSRGKIVGIGRQALMNDDMGVFQSLGRYTARARAHVNALVYSTLLTNAALDTDSVTLFHATSHGANMASGANVGDPSNALLAVAEKVMFDQTGPKGSVLNITPRFIMSGSYHKNTIEILVGSQGLALAQYSAAVKNPWQGLVPVFDANISGQKWFLAADQGSTDTMEVAFLNGQDAPMVQVFDADPRYLGKFFRVIVDVAVEPIDYRGMYYNPGA